MMKRETRRSEDFKKLAEAKQDRDVYKNKLVGCQVKTETIDQGSKSVDREVKFEDWQFDDLIREYHLKELKKLLSSDLLLKTIKPKLTGSLHGPISAPKPAPNVLEALRRLINLLTEAGFTAGTSIAQTLLECDHNRVIAAGQSLLRTLSPLIGSRDPGDNPPRRSATPINGSLRESRWIKFLHRSTIPPRSSTRDRPVMLQRSQKRT